MSNFSEGSTKLALALFGTGNFAAEAAGIHYYQEFNEMTLLALVTLFNLIFLMGTPAFIRSGGRLNVPAVLFLLESALIVLGNGLMLANNGIS